MSLKLIPLSENPNDGDLPLQWSLELWGDHIPGYSRQDWINFYENGKKANFKKWDGDSKALIFIGKRGEEVVGAISLVDFDDLEEFRYLTPWVAAFIVNPQLRGKGIGSEMLTALEGKAKALEVKVLHLWTEDKSEFYQKRGYDLITEGTLEHLTFKILKKELSASAISGTGKVE
ncbi:MAG: GNAT family N-acetyltransferase [Actinomycetota bacterium]